MATTDGTHICHFMLEQNTRGYFTGNFICTYCGRKVAQSQWFDTLTASSGANHLTVSQGRRLDQTDRDADVDFPGGNPAA